MRLLSVAVATACSLLTLSAHALDKRTLCVFDIAGTSGDSYNLMVDYRTQAINWGVDLALKVYTDEMIAAADLRAGQCDGIAITGIRGRAFNQYTGSIDSVGAIPSYKHLKTALQALGSGHPRIEERMVNGNYEVVGVLPLGAAYLFVKDKTINNVNKLAGKTISVMEYDVAQAKMAQRVGMSPVMSDITNFAGRFNNGSVEICFAPIMAYSALELYKGMQPNGGIINYVLGQLTGQIIINKNRFPAGFGAQSRKHVAGMFDQAMRLIDNYERSVDQKWWIQIPEADRAQYDEMMRDARVSLTAEGIYDKEMMGLLRRVRCGQDPSRAECVNPTE